MSSDMTKEEKQLLLKDLCGRLPYGVRVKELEPIKELELYLTSIYHDTVQVETVTGGRMACSIEAIKPYLRPMSSMTMEEQQKYYDLTHQEDDDVWAKCLFDKIVDFCNERHLDYRGLTEKGLALEAPEEMYKIE